jgi:hypothetical protein
VGAAHPHRFLQRGHHRLVPDDAALAQIRTQVAQALKLRRVRAARGALVRRGPGRHTVDQGRQSFDQLFGVQASRLVSQAGCFADGRHVLVFEGLWSS